eukprot:7096757-Prymnesium_polylepis.2
MGGAVAERLRCPSPIRRAAHDGKEHHVVTSCTTKRDGELSQRPCLRQNSVSAAVLAPAPPSTDPLVSTLIIVRNNKMFAGAWRVDDSVAADRMWGTIPPRASLDMTLLSLAGKRKR